MHPHHMDIIDQHMEICIYLASKMANILNQASIKAVLNLNTIILFMYFASLNI